jgi:3-oxoacyl-[acyl-carrier protein] reductase
MDVSGYQVIVTGGTRGIGRSVVEAFLRGGACVTATYEGNEAAARELRERWPDFPLELARFDVSDYSATESFFREYNATHSALDVLVCNAGLRRDSVVGMMPEADWRKVIDVNLTGSFNLCKFAVLKMMENRFGRIILVSSPSGKIGFAGQANYAASKAGQVAFAKSLARETGRRGITVNCVMPGFIDTDLIADVPDSLKKEYREQIPLRRFGRPDEVADGVLFLARRESAYITGSVLEITGGL